KIKFEIQYADYGEYEYPEPVVYRYGIGDYVQNYPYIVNFPEKRGLMKFTRTLGRSTGASLKYQYSELRDGVQQHLGELKLTHNLRSNLIGLVNGQWIFDTREFNAVQPGTGFQWQPGRLTILQGDAQIYFRGREAQSVGGEMQAVNARLKIRQVLTVSTALLVEYVYYDADGENLKFKSHSGSVWLSQFLPTQSALHLNFRYYDNSMGIRSWAPSIELAQYLNWAMVLRIKYRYYANKSENVSLGEKDVIVPDNLKSNTISVQLNREMSSDLEAYGMVRYYKSNLGVQMNTYLMGFVYGF
ncbi:MAG TPA: hypothetical protein VGB38_00635, partial [bacterium]